MPKKMYDNSVISVSINNLKVASEKRQNYTQRKRLIENYLNKIASGEYEPEKIVVVKPNTVTDYNTISSAWVYAWKEYLARYPNNPPDCVKIVDGNWHIPVSYITPCGGCKNPLHRGCRCIQQ